MRRLVEKPRHWLRREENKLGKSLNAEGQQPAPFAQFLATGWGSQAAAGQRITTNWEGRGRTCTPPAPYDAAAPSDYSLVASSTTSGLGSCTPSAHLLSSQRLPGLLPHLLTASPFPVHGQGGPAGQQIWAGCKARVISYLLSLFLKINVQGNDPKENSKYKWIHNSSASSSKTVGKSRQCEVAN